MDISILMTRKHLTTPDLVVVVVIVMVIVMVVVVMVVVVVVTIATSGFNRPNESGRLSC